MPPRPAPAPSPAPSPADRGVPHAPHGLHGLHGQDGPDVRRRLVAARVTGVHPTLSGAAVRAGVRALVAGTPRARLGCDGLQGCDRAEVEAALRATHGPDAVAVRAAIDPDATRAGLRAAGARVRAAAAAGARVAVATGRPASLLGLARWAADTVRAGGGTPAEEVTATVDGGGRRSLWWIDGVAVLTDGRALLADDGGPAGDDWLFAVGRPDLVVADGGFAGAALRAGVETVAWTDLDAPALALAAARGRPLVVVPLVVGRPAADYAAARAVLEDGSAPPG